MEAELGLYVNKMKAESGKQKLNLRRMAGYTHLDYKKNLDIMN
jgi:hypothetical protein